MTLKSLGSIYTILFLINFIKCNLIFNNADTEIFLMTDGCEIKYFNSCIGIQECWKLACSIGTNSSYIPLIRINCHFRNERFRFPNIKGEIIALTIGRNSTCQTEIIKVCDTPESCFSNICYLYEQQNVKIVTIRFMPWTIC